MGDYFHDEELEELERQDDGSDPFEGLSDAEKLEHLIDMEKLLFSDTWLYCLRGLMLLVDIFAIPWAFKARCAIGDKDTPIGAFYVIVLILCCVASYYLFTCDNCRQRAEKKLQAEKDQKFEAELQHRLSKVGTLTITDKVSSKRVAIRLLLCVGSVFVFSAVVFGLVIGMMDGFDSLMRDMCAPGWKNFFVFPVLGLAVPLSIPVFCKTLFTWNGSCLTFNKLGISGEVYNAFEGAQNVIDYYADKSENAKRIIKRYYDVNTESRPNCIKWTNFRCFSVHRNCIVLWQKDQMKAGILAKLYVKFGWNVCLNQYPLRILGTPAELPELKHMLGQIMPSCQNFLPGEKAVL